MKPASRSGALDGLRSLMCLWVLVGHTCSNTLPFVRSPRYAVDGFMLLSGFLMTYHYSLRKDQEPWIHQSTRASFYIRRFFHIAPLCYALLIPSYLLNDPLSKWREVLRSAYQSTSVSYGLARPLSILKRQGTRWGKTFGGISQPVIISATL